MDGIRRTPYQYPLIGSVNELVGGLLGYMRDPRRTQQMQGLAGLLESTGIPKTVERLAYGEPLTNIQRANVPLLRPETAEALLTVAPVPPIAGRATMAAGRAGERLAERMVPQIMERGGMPAGLLEGMATNTTSKMFIGASSPMFNKDMALKASQMAKKGSSPQEIWQATGTVKGPDGQWRQEISDKASRYDSEALEDLRALENFDYLKQTQPLGGTLEHPELYKAYPELSDMPVHFMPAERMGGAYGAYSPKHDRMTLSDQLTPEKARSSALHETQHAIQEREGFAVGGNARDFARMKNEALNQIQDLNSQMRDVVKWMDDPSTTAVQKEGLRKQYEDLIDQRMQLVKTAQLDPVEAYGNLMGEAEARLTQRRMDLTEEQRRRFFPFEYTGEVGYGLDVRPENLIYMTQSGDIVERGLLGAAPKVVERGPAQSLLDYRGSHTAPGPDFGAPLHDLTGGGQMYPPDVYSPKAAQYYGGGVPYDQKAFDIAQSFKDKPNAMVTIYRAVPKEMSNSEKLAALEKEMAAYMKRGTLPKDAENYSSGSKWYDWAYDEREKLRNLPDEPANKMNINAGDWVTLTKEYAKDHGESALKGQYKILSKKVRAKDLWTNADSIHEFGYHPSE